ncbi:hypothetical protein, partial [Bacteroides sp.]|uniref:hypothetical protein n=1 Tax=Bacteroides sp. TaxID=29523 RepID=UPI003D0FA0D7
PNEMLLGKPWATKFGLSEGDDLSEILNQGEEFFYKKLVDNYRKDLLEKDFDLHFHSAVDSDFYLKVFANEEEIKTFIADNIGNYSVKDVEVVMNSKGDKYRVDKKGNTMYPFNEELITVLTNNQGDELFLVTKEVLPLFDDNQVFSQVSISSAGFTNSIIKSFASKSKLFNGKTKTALQNSTYELYKLSNEEGLRKLAKKQAISFEMALNFIVSRIPAQSMQSFMNMRIAGFIESDTNIVYVPIEQLIYQGSDYDIDKAYILGAGVNKNGVFYSWSPFFSFRSHEDFNTSLNIPFPNGKMYSLKKKSESKLEEYVDKLNTLKKSNQSRIDTMIARASAIKNDKQRQKQLDDAEKMRVLHEKSPEVKELEKLINQEAYLKDTNAEFDISEIPHGLDSNGDVLNLEEFSRFLNIVQKYDNLIYTNSDREIVEAAINKHTTYKMESKTRTEALKNKIYSSMWSIGQSVKNNLLQTSPITMGPARDAMTNVC